jgi:hypothetical protein
VVVTAQVCAKPAEMLATPPVSPVTAVGVGESVVEPLPSWPKVSSPQQSTPPASVSAQLWP